MCLRSCCLSTWPPLSFVEARRCLASQRRRATHNTARGNEGCSASVAYGTLHLLIDRRTCEALWHLSPSFVVAIGGIPFFSIWLAIQAPHAPSRCRESCRYRAQTIHTPNTTRYSATSRRCSIDKLFNSILRAVRRRRLSTCSARRCASFDNSESYVSRPIDDQTSGRKARRFFSRKDLIVIATKENAAQAAFLNPEAGYR